MRRLYFGFGAFPFDARGVAPEIIQVVIATSGWVEDVQDHIDKIGENPAFAFVAAAFQARELAPPFPFSATSSETDRICRALVPVARTKKSVTCESPRRSRMITFTQWVSATRRAASMANSRACSA